MKRCEVCDRPMIQQFPHDPERDWYWYCPLDGTFDHIRAHAERARRAMSEATAASTHQTGGLR